MTLPKFTQTSSSNSSTRSSSAVSLSKSEKRARLRLFRSENVGSVAFFQLLRRHGSAEEALRHVDLYARQGGRRGALRLATEQAIEAEIKKTTQQGGRYLFHGESLYPSLLATIYDPPPILIYKGREDLFHTPALGIVGARNASLNAKKLAHSFSKALSAEGWSIVSGLARGIDTAAHEGALAQGTIACVAGGIDDIYPSENAVLFKRIATEGLLLTEAPLGTKPHATLFPRRNRLVSGLSRGVLVIEAALKSGSLITARLALEQDRDVFAIPGSPLDPRSQGTNRLIQQGAKLVQTPEDVLEFLQASPFPCKTPSETANAENLLEDLSPQEWHKMRQMVLDNLSSEPISVDELTRECHSSYAVIAHVVLELELAGHITRHVGNQISRNLGCA